VIEIKGSVYFFLVSNLVEVVEGADGSYIVYIDSSLREPKT
jgi:hypothetical protein